MTETKASRRVVVSLGDVAAHMDLPNDAWTAYLNRRSGELVTVTDEDEKLVETGVNAEDLPEWQAEILPRVREALESDDFLALPGKLEVDEYHIMERFSLGVENADLRDELLQAIRGRGAFRRFKEITHERGMADAWYGYRRQAFEDIAVGWLEANGVAYSREKGPPSDSRA